MVANSDPVSSGRQPFSYPSSALYPVRNHVRNMLDLSGLWQFQLDPHEVGEEQRWFTALPSPRQIAVPSSWNDLFDDARDYLGLAWYLTHIWVPSGWRGQQIHLRVGSANYAARVWVNDVLVAEHSGGYLPFAADITELIKWDQRNVLAISVENKQLPGRIPAGPTGTGGMFAGAFFPETTYDYFPYAGLQRPVVLCSVPEVHINDITVTTTIEGNDGIVQVRVVTSRNYDGTGTARLGDITTDLAFVGGAAETTVRVPSARLWSPQDPHLYPLTITLSDEAPGTDMYSLDIGIRTIAVRAEQLLLNGQPLTLRGWGRHEDFPVSGRGLNLPALIRDFELLKWAGGNAYRTAHYPHAEEEMLLADRLGVLVIDEIPAAELNLASDGEVIAQWLVQCEQDLRGMIARDKNHPSVILWSVANEPNAGSALAPNQAAPHNAVEAGHRFLTQLTERAHALDQSRPATLVGVQGGPQDWLGIPDVICLNRYYGWYTQQGQLALAAHELTSELDALHQAIGKPIVFTEFGADSLEGTHSTPPEAWTEEYQMDMLRTYLDVAATRPFVVGTLLWTFADFKTGQSIMRAGGLNHKGVFTRDRRPKMAAVFLRERWTSR